MLIHGLMLIYDVTGNFAFVYLIQQTRQYSHFFFITDYFKYF